MRQSNHRAPVLTLLGAALLTGMMGCQSSSGSGSGSSSSAPGGSAAPAAAASGSGAVGSDPAAQAASQMFPYLEKLATLVDQSLDPKAKDCKKLGAALGKFAGENADAMGKIRDGAGGKESLTRAMQKSYGDKYDKAIDKYLEATQVDCNGEPSVSEAATKLGL